ncbi:MAG: hypothetical protein LBL76_09145 [Treponema sp.]|jgi:hypothetical protein|nr:hypothetical protein [Treponema sp.]
MNPLTILQLDLRAPLVYRNDETLTPFACTGLAEERLFCFDLDADQGLSIEPNEAHYLGPLLFAGTLALDPEALTVPERFELPQGTYMFAQVKQLLPRDQVIWMAAEVQKEGLWQRMNLEKRLYLRYVVEAEKTITQVFRPYTP